MMVNNQHQHCTKFQHVPTCSITISAFFHCPFHAVTQARQSLFQVKHDFLHILCPFFCDLS